MFCPLERGARHREKTRDRHLAAAVYIANTLLTLNPHRHLACQSQCEHALRKAARFRYHKTSDDQLIRMATAPPPLESQQKFSERPHGLIIRIFGCHLTNFHNGIPSRSPIKIKELPVAMYPQGLFGCRDQYNFFAPAAKASAAVVHARKISMTTHSPRL